MDQVLAEIASILVAFSFAFSKAGRFNPLTIGRLAHFFHIKS